MNHTPNTRPGLTWVQPAEPAAAWIGGKRLLAKRICGLIAQAAHDCYCEPFVGMGGIFLRRSMRPAVEVINDVSGDLVNLYRILQRIRRPCLRPCAGGLPCARNLTGSRPCVGLT
jgi:DNA adenine methylase